MIKPLVLLTLLLPVAAHAACDGETYVDCPTADGRHIQACIGAETFKYAFGTPEKWDITLETPIADGTARPWDGMGSSFYSSIRFINGDYGYEVWTSTPKGEDEGGPYGGVTVMKGEETVADLACDGGTIAPPFTLEDAMDARGYCYDLTAMIWKRKPDCG